MIVSQTLPSPTSLAPSPLVEMVFSFFLISRIIFPDGAWIANFAGFFCTDDPCEKLLPAADEFVVDIAELGRVKGTGEDEPGLGE
jgi:hypothetical protein